MFQLTFMRIREIEKKKLYKVEFKGKTYFFDKEGLENFIKDYKREREKLRKIIERDLRDAASLGVILIYTTPFGEDPRIVRFEVKVERLLKKYCLKNLTIDLYS